MDRHSNLRCGDVASLLFAASLINALLAWPVIFGGRPSLASLLSIFNNGFNGALWDVQSFGYFFIIPNPDLYFFTTLSLTCLESSLVFMVPLAWWCSLLSGVADSGAFQNRCAYILRSCDT